MYHMASVTNEIKIEKLSQREFFLSVGQFAEFLGKVNVPDRQTVLNGCVYRLAIAGDACI